MYHPALQAHKNIMALKDHIKSAAHRAVGLNVRSLQSNCDAVEEDEEQHNMIKHLMSDDLLTAHAEAEENRRERGNVFRCASSAFAGCKCVCCWGLLTYSEGKISKVTSPHGHCTTEVYTAPAVSSE